MKQRHWLLSLILCAALLLGTAVPALAAPAETRLYNVYGDHMLFQQNADAVFAGEAAPGTALTVQLKNAAGSVVRSANGTAGADGTFSLSFPAPAGGYDAYTVTLSADGNAVTTLTDVVFGELWLSFGQSNMEYGLNSSPEGIAMMEAGETGSRDLRVLQVPHPVKDGNICADKLPQTEAQNCYWYTGDQTSVYGMSACAYFFAEKLLAELDMPVGVLNAAVGGSGIGAWIPRDAIEGDEAAMEAVASHGAYIYLEDWDKGDRQFHIDMTGLYNSKIAPLTNFRPAGGIWYQGETDLMLYNDTAYYCQLFNLMQDSYTDLFAHDGGRFPLVFTQIVSYNYGIGPYGETAFNETFTDLAAADPASRGEVVVHDLPLDYYDNCGAIHPMTKQPIGERMANCALALVNGSGAPTSSPGMTAMQAEGGSVTVTFSHAGDGLVCDGDALRGFAVYGKDGVCLPAKAEIVSADTVRLWNDDITEPVGATYAVNSISTSANLWSSYNGEKYLPAAAFGASDPAAKKLFDDAEWLRCETLTAWQNFSSDPGLTDVWTAKNAALAISDDAAEGSGSLSVKAEKRSFSVTTQFTEQRNGKQRVVDSMDTDYTRYGTLTVYLKNNGNKDVTLDQLRLYKGGAVYYCPLCLESGKNSAVIPADGKWHEYTFDLNELGLDGGVADRWSNNVLDGVTEVRLCFTGKDADIQMDGFRFTAEPRKTSEGSSLQRVIARILALFEKIKAIFAKAEKSC